MPNSVLVRSSEAESNHSRQGNRVAWTLQLLGAVLLLSSVIVLLFASHAGAAGISNGTVAIKVASSGSAATSPLPDGQVVDVSVAPNSTFKQSSLEAAGFPSGAVAIKVVECADPNGQAANLPVKPTDCEASTIRASTDLDPDGSLAVKDFTMYALPDPADLGDSSGTVCDNQHQCVLGFFTNTDDFTKPHLFSAPFLVTPSGLPNGAIPSSNSASSSSSSGSSNSASTSTGASPDVSVSSATLANTGSPTLWPWLLGAGCALLIIGSTLRFIRRPVREG